MAEPFIAEIRIFPFDYAPLGWAICDGQTIPISQNTALFSILGTTYGGDGRSYFQIPNLQGRCPIGFGQGPGLTNRSLGQIGGSETVGLNVSQMPAHVHAVQAAATSAETHDPTLQMLSTATEEFYSARNPARTLNSAAVHVAGQGIAHNNMQPYLTLNFCIALDGIYPPRD